MTEGKQFEADVINSFKHDNVGYMKLRDSYILDQKNNEQTPLNPFDFLVHCGQQLGAIECKSCLGKSCGFQLMKDEPKANIKSHQILALAKFNDWENQTGALLINFRDYELTFLVKIADFMKFVASTDKKSINIDDCKKYGMLIEQKKLRVHYLYKIREAIEG